MKRGEIYKIGRTGKLRARRGFIQYEAQQMDKQWIYVEIIHVIRTEEYEQCEDELHLRYAHTRVKMPYFREWFALTPKDISEICAIDETHDWKWPRWDYTE